MEFRLANSRLWIHNFGMLRAFVRIGVAIAAIAAPGNAGATTPAGKWVVDYADDSCILSRDWEAGQPGIAVRSVRSAREHDLLLSYPLTGDGVTRSRGLLIIGNEVRRPMRPIEIGEPEGATRRLVDTTITSAELDDLARAGSLRVVVKDRLDARLVLPDAGRALAALRACEANLKR